jgi:hypothetical protein
MTRAHSAGLFTDRTRNTQRFGVKRNETSVRRQINSASS